MKVILSRKGFDSQYGGYPSPIIGDKLVSLPIPGLERREKVRFSDLKLNEGLTYFDLMKQLKSKVHMEKEQTASTQTKTKFSWQELTKDTRCHCDPDICFNIRTNRKKGWLGALGQGGNAQQHLKSRVKKGDIFLFFGWFKNTVPSANGIRFYTSRHSKHVLFGYLEISEILAINSASSCEEWLEGHPHISHRGSDPYNTIYIGTERLSFNKELKGYGMFKYSDELVLSKEGLSRTKWDLPSFFRDEKVEISYHNKNSWKGDYFQSAARGQEFVISENEKVTEWAKRLINNNAEV